MAESSRIARARTVAALVCCAAAGAAQTAATAEDMKTLGKSINALAMDLWQKLAPAKGDFACSPGSIATALAMTAPGARGETQKELLRFLHVDSAEALPQFGALARAWTSGGDGKVRLALANRLFGDRGYPFEKPYLELLDRAFGAPLEKLDIRGAPEKARLHVNAWVAEQTAQKIRDLLPPRAVDSETTMLLANALHFLGDWARPFERERTRPLPFHCEDGSSKDVPTMVASEHFERAEVEGHELVQLRYVGKDFAMLLVLPPKDAPVQAWLAPKVLAAPDAWPTEKVVLMLPRFRVEPAETTLLKPTLQALGVVLAFDRARADLSGIANPPSQNDRLVLAEVYHKAFVRVDEKGTEAAAATVVKGMRAGAAPSKPPREVRFDRPFWFALRHLPSGAALFVGKVAEPRSE